MNATSRMLLQTFYVLLKDYGTTITFTKVGKADIDPETGKRDASADRVFPLPAVVSPVAHSTIFLAKLLGRTEKIEATYLVRVSDLPAGIKIETGDFFAHGDKKYRNLMFENYDNVIVELSGDTFT